jgi:DNA-binding winged helix-turn-helix (wHTH) protein
MRWTIGKFEFDVTTGLLRGITEQRLNYKDTAVLRFLIDNFGKKYHRHKLIAEAWGNESGSDNSLYQSVRRLRKAFGGDKESYIASYPYRLVMHPQALADTDSASAHQPPKIIAAANDKQTPEVLQSTGVLPVSRNLQFPDSSLISPKNEGATFVLSIDGIIVNSLAELIYERVGDSTIVECSSSYQRALEDFSFALVYGSQIQARWPLVMNEQPRLGEETKVEPAQLLISALPLGVYEREVFDEDLVAKWFLQDADHQNQIRVYIRSMGQCMRDTFFVKLCRDLIIREAAGYLGSDPSLFKPAKDPSEFKFGKEYYRHDLLREVPTLLGKPAFKTLVKFVPEYPDHSSAAKKNDKYDPDARSRFVMEIVFTHLATMHQYEKNSERHRTWRLPYALRAEVTKQASKTRMQRQLRNVVVRHALLHALRSLSVIDRKDSIIGVLAFIRGTHPFRMIREMLEELSLLELEPDASREGRAVKLMQEMRHAADPLRSQPHDRYSLVRNSVLKDLAGVDLDEYRARLSAFFPQLAMRGLGPSSRTNEITLKESTKAATFRTVA